MTFACPTLGRPLVFCHGLSERGRRQPRLRASGPPHLTLFHPPFTSTLTLTLTRTRTRLTLTLTLTSTLTLIPGAPRPEYDAGTADYRQTSKSPNDAMYGWDGWWYGWWDGREYGGGHRGGVFR